MGRGPAGEGAHEERLAGGYTGRMLGLAALGNGTIAIGMLTLSPLLPTIIAELEISPARAGMALSVMWALNAVGQYPGGRLSDQLSRRTLLVGSLAGVAVGFTALSVGWSFATFLLGVAIVGLASGFFTTTAYSQVSDLFVSRRGRAFGLYTASWDVGGVVSAGVAVVALSIGVWQVGFLPVAVLAALVALGVHLTSEESYAIHGATLEVGETARRLFGDARIRLVLVGYSLYLVTWQGAVSFLPTFLQAEKGISPALASGAFAALFAAGIVAKPTSGVLADRLGRPRVAFGALVLGSTGLAVLTLGSGPVAVLGGTVVFALGLMGFSPAMLAYVMALFPAERMGGDFGGVRTTYLAVGSVGPIFVGSVAEAVSYTAGFVGLLGCLIASAVVLAYIVATEKPTP